MKFFLMLIVLFVCAGCNDAQQSDTISKDNKITEPETLKEEEQGEQVDPRLAMLRALRAGKYVPKQPEPEPVIIFLPLPEPSNYCNCGCDPYYDYDPILDRGISPISYDNYNRERNQRLNDIQHELRKMNQYLEQAETDRRFRQWSFP